MEEILSVYQRPHDPRRPLVCLDEFCKQLLREVRAPQPAEPGRPAKFDCEYIREGSATAFMIYTPLEGRREIFITANASRTRIDYARALEFLSEEVFPDAEKIVLVEDNLNTHGDASLYQALATIPHATAVGLTSPKAKSRRSTVPISTTVLPRPKNFENSANWPHRSAIAGTQPPTGNSPTKKHASNFPPSTHQLNLDGLLESLPRRRLTRPRARPAALPCSRRRARARSPWPSRPWPRRPGSPCGCP